MSWALSWVIYQSMWYGCLLLIEILLWNEVGFIDKLLLKFVIDNIVKNYNAESWGRTRIFTFALY